MTTPETPTPASPTPVPPGARIGERRAPEDELQEHTRALVRAGFHDPDALLAEVVSSVEAELPGVDALILARAWIGGAQAELRRAAADWPDPTDHDQVQAAFAECVEHGVPVLQGISEREAAGVLQAIGTPPSGVVWFDQDAVWAALRTGVLDLRLADGSGTPSVEGDWLCGAVLSCLDRHGLRARWEGGVQVATRWQRRPTQHAAPRLD